MVSDDSFFHNFSYKNAKQVSTEFYLKEVEKDNYISTTLPELLKFNYRCLALPEEILIQEFVKFLNKEPNYYYKCLVNLSIIDTARKENAAIALNLVQRIYSSLILLDKKHILAQQVFTHLFYNLKRNSNFHNYFTLAIYQKFRFTPDSLNDVLLDFRLIWNEKKGLITFD